MGSIDNTASTKLATLNGEGIKNVSAQTIVETVWAITHFIYTGDNEVKFVRHFLSQSHGRDDDAKRQPFSTRGYRINSESTPADIASTGCDVAHQNGQAPGLERESKAPDFTRFLRQTELLLIEGQPGSGMNHPFLKGEPHSLLVEASVWDGVIDFTATLHTSNHQKYLVDLEDKMTRVCGFVAKNWNSPLSQYTKVTNEVQLSQVQPKGSSAKHELANDPAELLRSLWRGVLHSPNAPLGPDDNFFRVGGDSIKAIELVGALREHRRALTVSQIYRTPTLGEMAKNLVLLDRLPHEEPPKALELISQSISREDCIDQVARACQVEPLMVDDVYPATPMQEALMAISAHRPGVYAHRVVFKIPESLQIERFKKAWYTLVSKQPVFRTRIVTLPSIGTVQVVIRSGIDWHSGMSLHEFVQYDEELPYTYGSDLSRYGIVHDDEGEPHFVWSGHHAISDGWSRPAMFRDVQKIYLEGVATHQVPYTQFIRHLIETSIEESEEFWTEQFPDTVEIYPRLPTSGYSPQALQLQTIDISLERRADSGITTATLVQAAWALITAAYANTDEAVFGLTLSGRDAPVPGITQMMGITITTVPVRIVLDYTSTVLEYLEEVQEYILQVKQHQHLGLQRIYRLSPEAKSAASFQNLLVIQPAGEDEDFAGLTELGLQSIQVDEKDTRDYGITVQCSIGSSGSLLQVKAHYDEKVVGSKQVESMLHLFEHHIRQLATESTVSSLHDLDNMSPHDLGLLATWNASMPPAVEKTLHGLIAEKARETPGAVALDGPDSRVTYAELDSISSQLAGYIQEVANISPNSRVVLSFAKSTLPVFAILATLKSGGVCVSTNPEHPTPRLLEIVQDVESRVVLCDEKSVDRFKGQVPHVIGITDALIEQLKSAAAYKSLPNVLPSNESFVVYTSGSTGKPKGSVLEHRSLATHLKALGERIGLDERSRTLQFSAYTFDVHILEIVGTLVHGGCVCVISDHERMNNLSQVINERRVNFSSLTKTVSRLLDPDQVPTLKKLILTGEPNGRQDYWRWSRRVFLYNGLGPSECTPLVCLTRGAVAPDDDPSNIGHAMGCHLWVTDHRRPDRLVPIGCVGELVVEGPIVGRGYINRPRENAAAFVLDPAWSRDGSGRSRRFYRSGDLARMNTDGSITFIGRADNQVKIHGQRVELGEIEDSLRRCSHVFANSAVEAVTISSRGGTSTLAVFCSREDHEQSKLKRHDAVEVPILAMDHESEIEFKKAQLDLAKTLPQYMIPSIFLPVRHLPFNPSGKLERKTLHHWVSRLNANDLGQYFLTSQTVTRPPESDMEKKLQSLWAKVLNIPTNAIGAESHFFRSGGDSVLSMKLIAEARCEGIAMTVADVFRMPMLKDMALTIEPDVSTKPRDDEVARFEAFSLIRDKEALSGYIAEAAQDCGVGPDLVEDMYPCTPIQEALMAVSSHRPEAYTYQVVLKLPSSMDLDRFKSSWDTLVSEFAIFRTRIVFKRDVGSLQVVLRSNITWHESTGMPPEQYLEQNGTLHVGYGSELSRFVIVHHGGDTVFVGTFHHSLYDGWSLMRTYEEFSSIFLHGELARPVVPYGRFMGHLSSVDGNESDEFWRSQFPTITENYPRLPPGHTPRPLHNKSSTVQLTRTVGSEVTLATVVQTAWAILMSLYSGSNDLVFGLTLSGRDAPIDGITDMVGPTLTSVPIMMHINNDMTLGALLDSMQRKTTDIRRHQHVGLQRIRHLSPEASAAVDFRNLLVVHTMGDAEITSPLRALGIQTMKSKAEESLDIALTAECTIRGDALDVLINYDDEVVAGQQVDFIHHQLGYIISLLSKESPTTRLRDVDLVSADELTHMQSWNNNLPEYTQEVLHELVEAQARATPNAIATTGFDGEFTYEELDSITNKLAAYLTSIGVGPEKHVVLSFRKSTWPIIAMLAVLKSGGVCVSVNFEHPLNRRLDIVQDVEPVVILCDADQQAEYSGHSPHVVVVGATLFAHTLTQEPSNTWVRPKIQPSNAAFIVYTSGSTGKPKGCILEHHAVCLSQKINADTMDITSSTRALQFATYTWDPSILEIFGPLIRGGCVCVISDDERMNNLTASINARGANWTFQTPTVAQIIVPDDVPNLDTIVFCGEPLTKKVVQPWSAAGRAQMINFYSAAETSNIGAINLAPDKQTGLISIGRSSGCGMWVVQRHDPNQLVPRGCVGELLIEGHAVIRGYWNRQEANSAAFIEDPTWSRSGQAELKHRRFYRTGDIAYFNPDGSIQLLGRGDRQVKIRGQRVELHEIEYQIHQQLPIGSEVTAEIVELDAATLTAFIRLPTFCALEGQNSLQIQAETDVKEFQNVVESLQRSLPETLPQYMLPTAFVPISYTPRLATTKTDRKLLKQFAQRLEKDAIFGNTLSNEKTPPRDETEASLQLVWSQILKLGLDRIGVHDSFLALGGDSITAMQVVSECRRLGVEILVSTILVERTIAAIAPHCKRLVTPEASSIDKPHAFAHLPQELDSLLSDHLIGLGHDSENSLIDSVYPCTAMQEGILLSQQVDSEVYQIQYVWEFTDNPAFEENLSSRLSLAWDTIVHRHPSMRTGIIEHSTEHGHFLQVVLKRHPAPRFLQEKQAIKDVSEVLQLPTPAEDNFLTYMPRLTLYRTMDGRAICKLKVSHVLIDAVSLDVFMQELISSLLGHELASPVMNFAKYVEYEKNIKSEQSIAYWEDHLKNVQPCHVPTNNDQDAFSGLKEYGFIQLPENATEGMAAFCSRLGVTQAAFMQAAWAIVLATFTGQSDACFGYLASGRDTPIDGIEGSIGPIISMQICRVQIEATVKEILQRVNTDVIVGLEHRNCSLALIQNRLGLKATPLFNTCMTVRRALDLAEQEKLDTLIRPLQSPERTEYAIALSASVRATGAIISMSYQRGKISQDYARSIAGSLETVIRSLLESEAKPVHSIELIGTEDLKRVQGWNSPPSPVVYSTLHGLVEAQAQATPDAIATSGFDSQLTYGQLNLMSNRLAGHLIGCGVGPGARVVLCFYKSTWPVVAMLAILKAGGVCVSTNPDHPFSRLLDTCHDVETTVVMCDERNASRFKDQIPHVITVGERLMGQLKRTAQLPLPEVNPHDAAFVVYTSGSTGKPKGCVLEHHSVAKSQLVNAKAMHITSTTRVAQFAAYTFDASICEIFAPLVVGGCLCVISDDERLDDLAMAMNDRKANWIMLTPTVAQLLSPSAVPTLKTLVFGGEPLGRKALDIWCGHVKLVNYWGPTECSNSGCLNGEITRDTNPLRIGRASGCHVWITEQGNPHRLVPIGCIGEMVVEGTMLGRGYVNRPDATAAAFVTDLAWSRGGEPDCTRRFYRTGDLGQFNSDGTITIAGRADNQVKIHGQRVELDEIKHQIAKSLPSGGEVVVDMVNISNQSWKTLAAFIKIGGYSTDKASPNTLEVTDSEQQQEFQSLVKELETTLPKVLPRYMVPSKFIPITRVPLTPSVKTDKRLLREFAKTLSGEIGSTCEPNSLEKQPTSDMERDLQTVWAHVLNRAISSIGIDETFMSLGGDSISAMQSAAQCRKMGIKLPVAVILQKKTIAAIAPYCTKISMAQTPRTAVKTFDIDQDQMDELLAVDLPRIGIKSIDDVEDIFPVSPFQKFTIEGHLDTPPRHWECFYFDLPNNIDHSRLQQVCVEMAENVPILRTLFIKHAGGFLQVVLKSLEPQIDIYNSQEDIDQLMARLFKEDLANLPTLGRPFHRFMIARTPTHSRLLLRLSHTQEDGLSRIALVQLLATLYEGRSPPEIVSYSKFMHHLKQHHEEDAKYWRSMLASTQPTYIWDTAKQPPMKGSGVIRIEETIPHFRTEGVTPATLFNAACALLLSSMTNSTDIIFGRMTSGRTGLDAEFQNLIGPTLNIIPLRVHLKKDFLVSDVVQSVHKQYVDSIPYENIGLDDIIRNCTDWKTSMAKFPVVTQFLNVDENSEVQLAGGGRFVARIWEPKDVDPYPWSLCLGAYIGRSGVKISIAANAAYADRAMVQRILNDLCRLIGTLTEHGDKQLGSLTALS
ncbi:hypothetical protein JX266_008278 [Neoarthrinium moseri]|nr:hypothetical protein JX266_008278 [Neoarthrinium moseri]